MILLSCRSFCAPAHPVYRNLVFEGGGIRGIAYAGALQVLESHKITDSIEKVAGTSVGAIVAVLVAVGYNAAELDTILGELRIQEFNDGRYIFFGGFNRLNRYYGWYRGQRLENWIGDIIKAKTGNEHLTFNQLHNLSRSHKSYKDVYIIATNLSRQCRTIFSYKTYPDMEIKTAVRTSISIPLYFSSVFLDSNGKKVNRKDNRRYDVFVDGGLIGNYPLAIFDSEVNADNTLGLKLERPEQMNNIGGNISAYPIHSFRNYVGALYNLTIESLNRGSSYHSEKGRTIYISTGNIQPRVRKITAAEKHTLYNNGKAAALAFLKEHY